WEAVIAGSDYLLEKYTLGKPLETLELEQEENRRFQNCSLYPIYHGSAKNNVGIEQLIEVITNKFFSSTYRNQDEICGNVFKVEYSIEGQRLVYVRLCCEVLHLRDSVLLCQKVNTRPTYMYTPDSRV